GNYMGDGTNHAVVGAEAYNSNQGRTYVFNNPLVDQTVDETLTGQGTGGTPEQLGHALAGGKRSNDARFVLFIGGPFWDDTGETDPGRVTVGTIIRRAVCQRSRFTRFNVAAGPTSFVRRFPANASGLRYAAAEPTPTRIATNAAEKNGFRFISSGAAYAIVASKGESTWYVVG